MRFRFAALLGVAHLCLAAPITNLTSPKILPDGLPTPSPSELESIEERAHGTLPNGAPPSGISEGGLTNLKLVAFNELFEVAFFEELITNITEKVVGYRFSNEDDYDFVLNGLKVILAVRDNLPSYAILEKLLTDFPLYSKRSYMFLMPTMLSLTSGSNRSSHVSTTFLSTTSIRPFSSPALLQTLFWELCKMLWSGSPLAVTLGCRAKSPLSLAKRANSKAGSVSCRARFPVHYLS